MTARVLAAIALLLLAGPAPARTVALAELGSLGLEFSKAVLLELYPGQPVAATVGFRQGEAFSVPSPGRVQQIEYLVEPGAAVGKGQPFAVLRGPEMHHFEMAYDSSKALLAGAERRFKGNKPLYESKAISASQWQEISEKYYAALLEYEHMRHFFELVVHGDDAADELTLAAPLAGIVDYSSAYGGVEEGDSIALFVPQSAIRLEASIPNALRSEVAFLQAGDCRLAVERVSAMTSGFFVQAWTESLPSGCALLPGQTLLATPLLRGGAYAIPKSAVFQLERSTYVWLRDGSGLVAVEVNLLGADGDNYLLRSATALDGREILVSSVSAVQGILLGLGGE